MQIKVSGRHVELTETLKSYCTEKATKLERFYDRLQSVDVVFNVERGAHVCEMIAKADHHNTFIAKEQHPDAFASVDAAAKDLERQLSRHKERFRNRKHSGGRGD